MLVCFFGCPNLPKVTMTPSNLPYNVSRLGPIDKSIFQVLSLSITKSVSCSPSTLELEKSVWKIRWTKNYWSLPTFSGPATIQHHSSTNSASPNHSAKLSWLHKIAQYTSDSLSRVTIYQTFTSNDYPLQWKGSTMPQDASSFTLATVFLSPQSSYR